MKHVLTSLTFLSIVIATSASADVSLIKSYSNSVLLKNYALSQCVARAYQSQEVHQDALSVADGYLQFGEVSDVDAYSRVVKLAEKWLKKKYDSQSDQPLNLMKCIDFYHSRELQALLNKYAE